MGGHFSYSGFWVGSRTESFTINIQNYKNRETGEYEGEYVQAAKYVATGILTASRFTMKAKFGIMPTVKLESSNIDYKRRKIEGTFKTKSNTGTFIIFF